MERKGVAVRLKRIGSLVSPRKNGRQGNNLETCGQMELVKATMAYRVSLGTCLWSLVSCQLSVSIN